jgi:hypothetical protein
MSFHAISSCRNFSHFHTELKVLIGVQLSKQKAAKCFSWSHFRLRLEFKRIINEKIMDFSSLYLTPHYLLFVNENFASTLQEKFTHKWLNIEAFQVGMTTLSKISKWKDSSPIVNRVNSTETRVEISFSVYRRGFFQFISKETNYISTNKVVQNRQTAHRETLWEVLYFLRQLFVFEIKVQF